MVAMHKFERGRRDFTEFLLFWRFRLNSKLLEYDLKWSLHYSSLPVAPLPLYTIKHYQHAPEHWSATSSNVKPTSCESPCSCLGADKASNSHTSAAMLCLNRVLNKIHDEITWKNNIKEETSPSIPLSPEAPRQNSLKTHVNSTLNILHLNSKS